MNPHRLLTPTSSARDASTLTAVSGWRTFSLATPARLGVPVGTRTPPGPPQGTGAESVPWSCAPRESPRSARRPPCEPCSARQPACPTSPLVFSGGSRVSPTRGRAAPPGTPRPARMPRAARPAAHLRHSLPCPTHDWDTHSTPLPTSERLREPEEGKCRHSQEGAR